VRFVRLADMRYQGQEHSITIRIPDLAEVGLAGLKAAFDTAHIERFAHGAPEEPAEIVSLRVAAVRTVSRPPLTPIAEGGPVPPDAAARGSRPMVLDESGAWLDTPIWDRFGLVAGNLIEGPAAIVEGTTTTLLRPGDRCEVDAYGNLLLTIGRTR
jgi:N-methylhydantoinase A